MSANKEQEHQTPEANQEGEDPENS
jgi:hypothetical protein